MNIIATIALLCNTPNAGGVGFSSLAQSKCHKYYAKCFKKDEKKSIYWTGVHDESLAELARCMSVREVE